jgi:outer membrane lipoprotein SlyB
MKIHQTRKGKNMNMNKLFFLVAMVLVLAGLVYAQDTPAAQPASMTASLNKKLGIFVFPAKDQKADQQAKDEQACYSWAVQQSGVDPLNMQATKPDSVAKGPDGSAVKGAAKGAVAGAAIGAIAGDAGKGAAIGAAAGGMGGVAGKKKKDAQKQQQAQQTAAATDAAKIDSFKKAYSACLDGKGYSVK